MIVPIVLLGGGALVLYLLSRAPGAQAPLEPGGVGQQRKVTGASGKRWAVVATALEGDKATMTLYAEPNQFGPHSAFPVLQYTQIGDDKSTRRLLVKFQPAYDVPIAYTTALGDFGIIAPPPVT